MLQMILPALEQLGSRNLAIEIGLTEAELDFVHAGVRAIVIRMSHEV